MIEKTHLLYQFIQDRPTPLVIGILNVTPDSFSDGNLYSKPDKAFTRAKEMIDEGAGIIDVGGESSRPGAKSVSSEEELQRIIPVIRKIREASDVLISVDTRKAEVARQAIRAGAAIINDISSLRSEPEMIDVLLEYPQTALVLMHMQGTPETMQDNPHYENVTEEICSFFEERISLCLKNGIERNRLVLDPGIGFGKLLTHNLELIANTNVFHSFRLPIILGASRKRFINEISPCLPEQRIGGSLATTAFALQNKLEFIRVHDVKEHCQFIHTYHKLEEMTGR